MADKETATMLETNQIATTDLAGAPASPGLSVPQPPPVSPPPAPSDPHQVPDPQGSNPAAEQQIEDEAEAKGADAPGIEAEQVVWEARYSLKNFIGRLTFRAVLSLAWFGLLIYTFAGDGHPELAPVTIIAGVVLGIIWVALLYRMLRACYGHHYRLTNRRLFVSTGLLRRRCDQMELLHVKDVFTRQTLVERWLSLGTTVVVSKESELPTFYLAGVNDPDKVMDLVWHCARAEREGKAVQVDNV